MDDASQADDAGTKFDIVKSALREKRAEAEHAKEKAEEKAGELSGLKSPDEPR